MKYHKIPKVEKNICTAEQMIAYNIAFRIHINHGDEYEDAKKVTAICADELLHDLIAMYIGFFADDMAANKNGTQYDLDAIQSCLNAGLADYLNAFFIATDYAQVGKAFPAYYLK